jgi:tetratricopeptide (TPR) repeat protein
VNNPGQNSISLCMIVRDEEDRVGRCISSVADVVDEIIIVDTGSTDGTPAIVESLGARVVGYVWDDDFAAARNAGLDLATGNWILVLDADEEVSRDDHAELRRMAAAGDETAYRFITRNYGNEPGVGGWVPCVGDDVHARGFSGWHPSVKVRMFPNRKEIRFRGRVHELVRDSLDALGMARVISEVAIHHYGRGPAGLGHDKQLRYLELGRQKVVDNPDDAKPRFELGNLLAEMGRTDESSVQYECALKLAPGSPPVLAALGSIRYRQGRYGNAAQFYRDSLDRDPDQPETRRNLATALITGGEWAEARDELAELAEKHGGMHDVRFLQGLVAKELGDLRQAVELLANELEAWPGNRRAAEMLADLAADPELVDHISEIVGNLLDKNPHEPSLQSLCGEALYHMGEVDEAVGLLSAAVETDPANSRAWNNLAVAKLGQNLPWEALEAFQKALHLDPHNPLLQENIRLVQEII